MKAWLAGAAAVLGFAPLDFFPATLLALAVLIHLWLRAPSARAAGLIGFLFGLGYFLAGVSWVYVSLNRYGAMPAALAAFATLAFCALLAIFPALVGWAQAKLPPSATTRTLAIAGLWTLTEWLRGSILSGFPWLAIGHAAIDTPLAGYAPLGGTALLSLLTLLAAGFVRQIASGESRVAAAAGFAALGIAGAGLQGIEWTSPSANPLSVSLLQGNVAQDLKFDPQRYERTLETYARLAEGTAARLIVMPETALPRFLDLVSPAYLERLRAAALRNGGDLLLGVARRTGPLAFHNSVISLGESPTQAYDKAQLVPLGEFVPPGFDWIPQVLHIPMADFTPGTPEQPALSVAGERVAVNICYELAYGARIAARAREATLLVNVSNMAWFGDSLAPGQHLQIARMRALEAGRPLLTATNTGITAAIDADGRVLGQLPQFSEARLELQLRGHQGTTPYSRWGDLPALAAALLLIASCAWRRRSR